MKNLQQELPAVGEGQLRRLYRLWGMSRESNQVTKKLHSHLETLFQRSKNAIAARFVWEQLSPGERTVLYRVVNASPREGAARDAILKKAELTPEHFAEVLSTLKQYLLVYESTTTPSTYAYAIARSGSKKNKSAPQPVVVLYSFSEIAGTLRTVGRELLRPEQDYTDMTLDEVLEPVKQAELLLIIQRYGLQDLYYYSRVQMRQLIKEELSQHDGAVGVVQKLPPAARNLLKWLCDKGGHASMQEVRTSTGYDDEALFTVLSALEEHAVAFDKLSSDGRLLFVPQGTYELIKQAIAHPEIKTILPGLRTLDKPPQHIQEGDALIQYDLAIIIAAAYQQDIEPTRTAGTVPKRLAAKIEPLLHGMPRYSFPGDEDDYLEMLFIIAQELELLQLSQPPISDVKARYTPGTNLDEWAQMDIVEQSRQLLGNWMGSYRWKDLVGANYTRAEWAIFGMTPLAGRKILVDYLRKCTPRRWYSVSSLLNTIWTEAPLALHQPYYGYGSFDNRQRSLTGSAARTKWMQSDGEIYIGSLASTLFELGIVTPSYEQSQEPQPRIFSANPDAFMLTELGAAALAEEISSSTTTENVPPTSNALVVQPNFELLLLHPDMATLYQLLPFAQVNQVSKVSRLTLTRTSVLRGVNSGLSIEQILSTLAERTQKELPQNVEYTLRDWTKHFRGIKLSEIVLLEVSDEALADEICASPKLRNFRLRRLGPRAVAAGGDVNQLRRALDKEGIVVTLIGGKASRY